MYTISVLSTTHIVRAQFSDSSESRVTVLCVHAIDGTVLGTFAREKNWYKYARSPTILEKKTRRFVRVTLVQQILCTWNACAFVPILFFEKSVQNCSSNVGVYLSISVCMSVHISLVYLYFRTVTVCVVIYLYNICVYVCVCVCVCMYVCMFVCVCVCVLSESFFLV